VRDRGNHTILNGPGNDRTFGEGGNDLMRGRGADHVSNAAGADELFGNEASATLTSGMNTDRCGVGLALSGTVSRLRKIIGSTVNCA